MGRQFFEQWTTLCFSLYQDCHHIPAALSSTSSSKGRLIPLKNWEHYEIQWQHEVTSMHAGNRCWQIMTSRPRWTVNQQTRWTRKSWFLPFTVNLEDLQTHVLAHSSERANSESKGDASKKWRHKNGSTVFMLTSAKKKNKRENSASWRVWWLDNSRAHSLQRRTWISEQSPIRNQDTNSRHSMESVLNQNFTGDGEEFSKDCRNRRMKAKLIHTNNLSECGKHCIESSWNHRNNYTSSITDKQNCRTNRTSSKRRDISRIIAIWIGW